MQAVFFEVQTSVCMIVRSTFIKEERDMMQAIGSITISMPMGWSEQLPIQFKAGLSSVLEVSLVNYVSPILGEVLESPEQIGVIVQWHEHFQTNSSNIAASVAVKVDSRILIEDYQLEDLLEKLTQILEEFEFGDESHPRPWLAERVVSVEHRGNILFGEVVVVKHEPKRRTVAY